MKVHADKCKGCGHCVSVCPQGSITIKKRKATIWDSCCDCGACARVCSESALYSEEFPDYSYITCESCPVRCKIKFGFTGACQRYRNTGEILERVIPLQTFDDVQHIVGEDWRPEIRKPLITAIGSGTTYPDCKPAPNIVQSHIDGVDVVTVVTEAPLSYSGLKLKIDTDLTIGTEGAGIFFKKKRVGHLTTEEYGSKILSLGGVNLLTGPDGMTIAKLITDLTNRQSVKLRVEKGSEITAQIGAAPVIDGQLDEIMRVGCGSATLGLFAHVFKDVADETIVLDSHLTGLFSEHAAGQYVGARPSGVKLKFRRSTPGRYFGDHGDGWGGTSISRPQEIIESIDMDIARPGLRILITETTGRKAAMFEVDQDGKLIEIDLTEQAVKAVKDLSDSCEKSRVSGIYCGGSGGSARAGVTRYPIKLTQAVHKNKVRLTVGGASAFVLPGGGINFMVDVEKIMQGAFTWVPTPATVCPIEYTMTLEDYIEMGGHEEAIRPFVKKV